MSALSSRQILATIADPGAGPSHSVVALARNLARLGVETGIDTVAGWRGDASGAAVAFPELTDVPAHPRSRLPGYAAACGSAALLQALRRHAHQCDILHTHGLWLMPNVYPSWAVRRPGVRAKLVLSPRGMLGAAALAFSPIKKRVFWTLLQRRAMNAVGLLHATSKAEYEDIRAFGLSTPVAIIPNGIDLPPEAATTSPADGPRTLLSLGRLHPKKGLDVLLRAWARIESERPDWRLRIVGPAENGHDAELRALSASLGLQRATIDGPLYDDAKLEAYRYASLFILPTRNENFAMTVAEALAAGTPVVSSKGAPWSGLVAERCGWWVDHGPEPLAAALSKATSLPISELHAMGRRGRDWMARDFSWTSVARDMAAAYRWLAHGAALPEAIKID